MKAIELVTLICTFKLSFIARTTQGYFHVWTNPWDSLEEWLYGPHLYLITYDIWSFVSYIFRCFSLFLRLFSSTKYYSSTVVLSTKVLWTNLWHPKPKSAKTDVCFSITFLNTLFILSIFAPWFTIRTTNSWEDDITSSASIEIFANFETEMQDLIRAIVE